MKNRELIRLRRDLKMTLHQFAEVVGISYSQIGNCELGTRNLSPQAGHQIIERLLIYKEGGGVGEKEG